MTEEESNFLKTKLTALKINQKIHYSASERYQRINWALGSLVILLSTGVGAFTFTDSANFPPYFTLVISLGSLISALLASVLTFSSLNELASRHKNAGTHYGFLARKVEGWLAHDDNNADWTRAFDELNSTWCEISDAAPITYFKARKKLGDE